MTWIVFIRPEAEKDLEAARDWYDDINPELGDRFLDEVASALQELEQDPKRKSLYYSPFSSDTSLSLPLQIVLPDHR